MSASLDDSFQLTRLLEIYRRIVSWVAPQKEPEGLADSVSTASMRMKTHVE